MWQTEISGAPDQLYAELWVSLASLLSSYSAVHGMNEGRQAAVELNKEQLTLSNGTSWLQLRRDSSLVTWQREDGRSGELEFTETGRLRSNSNPGEEAEMDMMAERWARELMQ